MYINTDYGIQHHTCSTKDCMQLVVSISDICHSDKIFLIFTEI